MWTANVLTLFPQAYPGLLGMSVVGKALRNRIWELNVMNLRDFSYRNGKVDDIPFGGGSGMVIKPDIVDAAISSIPDNDLPKYCLSPRGMTFNQNIAFEISKQKGAIFVCGRYEGIDERVIKHHDLKEISIGDYIISGGDLAAMVILDSVIRLMPKVIGNEESLYEESFNNNLLEYPLYTKPRNWNNLQVPNVLVSGDHKKIKDWKINQSESITRKRRPDLWKKYLKSK
tara:strand:- start:463 stop:1149 length:687 start_codon:yes stop_codon:yes gene_type:complete